MGKGVLDENSPLYIGTAALSDDDYVHRALDTADLVIMIGHDITEKPPVLDHKRIVHINFYSADIDAVYLPIVEVIGDISYALWAICEQIRPNPDWDFSKIFEFRDFLKSDINDKSDDSSSPIKPQRLVSELRSAIPKSGILSLDNGMYKIWIARNYPAYEQNTVLLDNALATMGAGLPVGMAAKLLQPARKVVVVAGDGGFMMNLADLETAKRLELDLVIIVLNDSGYGMIKWKQKDMGLSDFGLSFTNPDFVKLAESFGVTGHKVEKSDDFKPTLETALDQSGIHIIDVPIDYAENNTNLGDNLKERVRKS
jgi:acetolactate synthase I/II/III large subunit